MSNKEIVIDDVPQRMSNKEAAMHAISVLPDDASMEEIARQVEFVRGLEVALEQAERGEGKPIEQVRELIKVWARQSS